MTGWILLAVLYVIGLAHFILRDMLAMWKDPFLKWSWSWRYLAYPIYALGEVRDHWRVFMRSAIGRKP